MQSYSFKFGIGIVIFFLTIFLLNPAFGYENLIVSRDEAKKIVAEKLAEEISENWSNTLEGKFENLKGCSTYVPKNWAHKTHYFYIDRLPPSFNVGFHKGVSPLVINANEIPYDEFSHEKNPIELHVKEPVQIVVRIFEESGAENVQTISLSMNHYGTDLVNTPPETTITWNSELIFNQIPKTKGFKEIIEQVQINDPDELFSQVDVSASRDGHNLELIFNIKFANQMSKSNIVLFASDRIGNPMICNILDALVINSSTMPQIKNDFSKNDYDYNCKKPLIQVAKTSNGEMICVKPSTAEILLERNWIVLPAN